MLGFGGLCGGILGSTYNVFLIMVLTTPGNIFLIAVMNKNDQMVSNLRSSEYN